MIKLIRGWRVLRVGRGRVLRMVLVAVLFVLAWHTLLSRNGLETSSRSHPDSTTHNSPNLHGVAPIKEPQSSAIPVNNRVVFAPAQPQPPPEANEVRKQWKEREDVLRGSDNINPRYNVKAMKDKLHELQPKPVRNQQFLQQNPLNLQVDFQEEGDYDDDYDEDDDDDGDEEGKWKGRNKDDNVAIEEDDDENGGHDDDADLGQEDVGGEKFKNNDDDNAKKSKKEKRRLEKEKENLFGYGNHIGEREDRVKNDGDMEDRVKNDGDREDLVKNDGDNFDKQKEQKHNLKGKKDNIDMKTTEHELELRRSRVRKVCAKYGLGPYANGDKKPVVKHPPTPNYDVFYVDRRDELAWCPIYKAASTSWLHNFLILGGLDDDDIKKTKEQISSIARKVWPPLDYKDVEQAFKTCLKFMIVRHPFERLVSAYRDKLENTNIGKEHGVEHFYKKYGRKIVAKFRPAGQGPPSLRYSQDMDDPSIPPPKGIEPTFGEFVKYIIATDLVYYADDHWMPYYLHCTPCLVDYDVLAKFETLERDQRYIIKKKKLQGKIQPSWKHLTKGVKTSDTIRKYFATISKKDLMALYDKYKLDFELFDYSMNEYLSMVRDTE